MALSKYLALVLLSCLHVRGGLSFNPVLSMAPKRSFFSVSGLHGWRQPRRGTPDGGSPASHATMPSEHKVLPVCGLEATRLPRSAAPSTRVPTHVSAHTPSPGTVRPQEKLGDVLVTVTATEDVREVLADVQRMLEDKGFAVRSAWAEKREVGAHPFPPAAREQSKAVTAEPFDVDLSYPSAKSAVEPPFVMTPEPMLATEVETARHGAIETDYTMAVVAEEDVDVMVAEVQRMMTATMRAHASPSGSPSFSVKSFVATSRLGRGVCGRAHAAQEGRESAVSLDMQGSGGDGGMFRSAGKSAGRRLGVTLMSRSLADELSSDGKRSSTSRRESVQPESESSLPTQRRRFVSRLLELFRGRRDSAVRRAEAAQAQRKAAEARRRQLVRQAGKTAMPMPTRTNNKRPPPQVGADAEVQRAPAGSGAAGAAKAKQTPARLSPARRDDDKAKAAPPRAAALPPSVGLQRALAVRDRAQAKAEEQGGTSRVEELMTRYQGRKTEGSGITRRGGAPPQQARPPPTADESEDEGSDMRALERAVSRKPEPQPRPAKQAPATPTRVPEQQSSPKDRGGITDGAAYTATDPPSSGNGRGRDYYMLGGLRPSSKDASGGAANAA